MKKSTIHNIQALLRAKLFLFPALFFIASSCKKEERISVNWTPIETGVNHPIKGICFFQNSDTLFACGGTHKQEGVILRSTDAGEHWQTIFLLPQIAFNGIYFKNTKVGFALAHYSDIYKTTDGGATWIHTLFLDTILFEKRASVCALQFKNDSVAFALGGDNFGEGIILKSTDNGDSWRVVEIAEHELRDLHFIDSKTGFASGYGTLLKTIDGGQTWPATSLSDEFFTGLKFVDSQLGFMCGYNGTLLRTQDGGENWSTLLEGNSLLSKQRVHFNAIDFYDSEIGISSGEEGYTLLTQDGGESWKMTENEDHISIHKIKFVSPTQGWAVGDGGVFFKFSF